MESEYVITPQGEIAKALAAAQGEMSNPRFDADNPYFKSRYATLANVRNAVIPVLAKHGICLTQNLLSQPCDNLIGVVTTLTHESGQRMQFGPLWFPVTGKMDAQAYAAATTYCRRYTMQAVAGVVGDSDDDGNGSVVISPTDGIDLSSVDPDDMHEYVARVKVLLNDDKTAEAHALWGELTREEQVFCWKIKQPHGLNMKQKEKLRTDHASE